MLSLFRVLLQSSLLSIYTLTRGIINMLLALLSMSHAASVSRYPGSALVDDSSFDYPLDICAGYNVSIEEMSVHVNLSHTWVGDIQITMIAPSGQELRCFDESWSGANGLDITFKDSAPNRPGDTTRIDACDQVLCTGEYRCEGGNFSQFSTNSTNLVGGLWVLRIADVVGGDSGYIWSYSLVFPNVLWLESTCTPTATVTPTPTLTPTPTSTPRPTSTPIPLPPGFQWAWTLFSLFILVPFGMALVWWVRKPSVPTIFLGPYGAPSVRPGPPIGPVPPGSPMGLVQAKFPPI